MAESRFIRTVTYGGFDRNDVNKRLEYLYGQLYELKNELREAKRIADEFRKGSSEEKAHESVLAVERTKLTDELVQNEKLTAKLKTAEEDAKALEDQIAGIKKENQALRDELKRAMDRLAAFEAGTDAAALSTVFIEAQKSANLIIENARKEAEEKTADAQKLAEDTVAEANNSAKQIVFNAEKEAAQITAEAKNHSEEMKAASGNLRAVLIKDIEKMQSDVDRLKGIFAELEKNGLAGLADSEQVLGSARGKLTEGGVPVFKNPDVSDAEIPAEPEYEQVNTDYRQNVDKEAEKKKLEELEKLRAMAASIGGGKPKEDKSAAKAAADLEELTKMAASLDENADKPAEAPEPAPAEEKPASGGVSLEELMKQAASLK
ncbi:MAG: plectin [Ruminococcus sp.]|nr:plectin [Ruminococcus sp.]